MADCLNPKNDPEIQQTEDAVVGVGFEHEFGSRKKGAPKAIGPARIWSLPFAVRWSWTSTFVGQLAAWLEHGAVEERDFPYENLNSAWEAVIYLLSMREVVFVLISMEDFRG
jgi:hypothetical protein